MIKAQLSSSFWAKYNRIRRLPKMYESMMSATRLRDAKGLIKTFQDGIDGDTFRLERLKPATISRKARMGVKRPRRPLHGKGKAEKNSYRNAFLIRKVKNGYRVKLRKAKHWSGRLTLEALFMIHEFGATIKRGDTIIKLPARPAFEKAKGRLLRRERKKEPAQEVRAAISAVLRTGSAGAVRNYVRKVRREGGANEARS